MENGPSSKKKRQKLKAFLILFSLAGIVHSGMPIAATAQVRPVNDYGVLGLGRLLKKLNTTASVMMIGSHPDDEDSALLAYLARRENAETAYLSLTRGDGGQNIIGPELFESLGVIRTEELLQARRLDGARQFFTRAFDYGFSKALAEAKQKWDEKVILCDTVRAIRTFRPLVVISRFSGTPADGHGQHQYSGYISPIAVKAAADPQQCKESGAPWQVLKFYVGQGFGDNTKPPTLRLNTGEYDPMLGRSYFEIAMEGRSQHRSQGEGRIEFRGEQFSGLNLVETKVARVENEKSVFDGIDTSIKGIANLIYLRKGFLDSEFAQIGTSAKSALSSTNALPGDETIKPLLEGLTVVTKIRQEEITNKDYETPPPWLASLTVILIQKEKEFSDAIRLAAGLQIDALTDKETVVPGEDFFSAVRVFFPTNKAIKVNEIKLKTPSGWSVSKTEEPKENNQAFNRREAANHAGYFKVQVPGNAMPTQPYWLADPRDVDLYRWTNDQNQNMPFQPPLVIAEVKIEIDGTEITLNQPVQFRYGDPARGELRRELNIVPPVSLAMDNDLAIIPRGSATVHRRIAVGVTNNTLKNLHTSLLVIKPGFDTVKAKLEKTELDLGPKESTTVQLEISVVGEMKSPPFLIAITAKTDGRMYGDSMNLVAYPHIQTHRFYTRAVAKVVLIDLVTTAENVGYIMGSGDEVPDAIRQMGLDVTMLDEKDLASGDLSKYDSIVVGIRASETRPDFVSNNQRLLDYVKSGGNLIVQYQRGGFTQLLPFPATMGPRVVDENAKVTILQPDHPFFSVPNKITDEDFKGWVQERNLYNFNTFDEKYIPLLESHDVGEKENLGGMVYADYGKGKYIYTSYSWFRQLPAGNPGAYRIFANMLSLPKAK